MNHKGIFTAAQPWLASGLVVGSGEKEEEKEEEEKNLEIAFRIMKGLTKV